MASKHGNFIECTTGTEGTGNITVVRKDSHPMPLDVYNVDDTFECTILNGNNRENGLYTVKAADVIERTTIYSTYIDSTNTYDDTSPSALTLSGTSSVGVVNSGQNIDAPTVDSLTSSGAITTESAIIDSTGTEALLVRKDADGGDVFAVDTMNSEVKVTGDILLATIGDKIIFGDGDTYIRERIDDSLSFHIATTERVRFNATTILYFKPQVGSAGTDPRVNFGTATTATAPGFNPIQTDTDTGHGSAGADIDSHAAGGIEYLRATEVSSHVIVTHQGNYGLTADVGSAQGNGVILSSNNEYSVVANAGDAATLPTAVAGVEIKCMNNGANSMDVFPANGDDIDGAGVNVAYSLAAGARVIFHASDSTNWNAF